MTIAGMFELMDAYDEVCLADKYADEMTLTGTIEAIQAFVQGGFLQTKVDRIAHTEQGFMIMADFGADADGQDETSDKEHFTAEEIAESDMRVALITELVKARQEQGISQRQLEEMSGVKQPQIARMERGDANPQLDTLLKVLVPLGKTLAIVPITRT